MVQKKKRGGGRPKIEDGSGRSILLGVRVSELDRDFLQRVADEHGLTSWQVAGGMVIGEARKRSERGKKG